MPGQNSDPASKNELQGLIRGVGGCNFASAGIIASSYRCSGQRVGCGGAAFPKEVRCSPSRPTYTSRELPLTRVLGSSSRPGRMIIHPGEWSTTTSSPSGAFPPHPDRAIHRLYKDALLGTVPESFAGGRAHQSATRSPGRSGAGLYGLLLLFLLLVGTRADNTMPPPDRGRPRLQYYACSCSSCS